LCANSPAKVRLYRLTLSSPADYFVRHHRPSRWMEWPTMTWRPMRTTVSRLPIAQSSGGNNIDGSRGSVDHAPTTTAPRSSRLERTTRTRMLQTTATAATKWQQRDGDSDGPWNDFHHPPACRVSGTLIAHPLPTTPSTHRPAIINPTATTMRAKWSPLYEVTNEDDIDGAR
jgi:hypothetical protein